MENFEQKIIQGEKIDKEIFNSIKDNIKDLNEKEAQKVIKEQIISRNF